MRARKKADQTEAINNAKQIGLALFEFEIEYGSFPDAQTAAAVALATATPAVSGGTANDLFRQLLRSGITQSEAMFYAKTGYTKKPDGIFTSNAQALDIGENAYGIIQRADGSGLSAAGNPSRPVIATPFQVAMGGTFDYDQYDGKAVILKLDNSVISVPIVQANGNVSINGSPILATGANTVWGTSTAPAWAYPVPKK